MNRIQNGIRNRAATWGRPYGKLGVVCSVAHLINKVLTGDNVDDMLNELISNLSAYLQAAIAPTPFWECVANVACPIITTVAVVIGGGFALYKYRAAKNYEINLKILNEVYVPLYSYLVKQETFRYIALPDTPWEEYPIFEIKRTRKHQTWNGTGFTATQNTASVCGCTRDEILSLCESANLGLASTELVNLLNTYKILCNISDGNINSSEKAKSVILQRKVELALRKEILKGYLHYHKKLKLHNSSSEIYRVTEEQIEFLPKITEEEIQKERIRLDSLQ